MKEQKLYSYLRQAIDAYQMIEEGDRIAVGISGGKDSLTLLYGLAGLKKFYPKTFELEAITVDLGYEGFDTTEIKKFCQQLEVPYTVVKTSIGDRVKEGECSLCARLRKGAFNEKAMALGCNKIAYAHNQDDVIETMLLSLLYEGRFISFYPVTTLSMGEGMKDLQLIRPMLFVPQVQVKGFQNKYQLPVQKNPCPFEKETQRAYVREMIGQMHRHTPGVKQRLFTAIEKDFYMEELAREMYRQLVLQLIEKKWTISTMESVTAGQIATFLTDQAGASAIYPGGFVTYSNQAKIAQGVPDKVINIYGVYSRETAIAMAKACRGAYDTQIGIGVTGTAGNVDENNPDSRPGKVYVGISFFEEERTEELTLAVPKKREDFKYFVAAHIATILKDMIK